jgi:hypothetical protein
MDLKRKEGFDAKRMYFTELNNIYLFILVPTYQMDDAGSFLKA